jgi:GGDEF domain-containing protein
MSARKDDITIIIRQDNDKRAVFIDGVENAIEDVIGYTAQELKNMDLTDIVLPEIAAHIINYVDYEDGGRDVASVLNKVHQFGFVTKLGQEMIIDMKVTPALSEDSDMKFNIFLRGQSELSKGSGRVLKHLRDTQKQDVETGLADRESFFKSSEFINFCIEKDRLKATVALVEIDQMEKFAEKYDNGKVKDLVREVGVLFKRNFREDDVIAMVDDGLLAVILLESTSEVAQIPLNRLRWQLSNQALEVLDVAEEDKHVTLSTTYCLVTKGNKVEDLLDACKEKLKELHDEGGNTIHEVVVK